MFRFIFRKRYKVGDTVVYRAFSGKLRSIRVTERFQDVKNGRAGFDGVEFGTGKSVWGYDDQIVNIRPRIVIRRG